jgi:hypothetical protein
MNNLTANVNFLTTVSFKLILNSLEFANTEYFAVTANIPSISISESNAGFRNKAGYVPGDKLMFDPLTIRVAVDENFAGYIELYQWMKGFSTKASHPKVCDMTLVVMSSHNNAIKSFRFVNAFPTNLGQIDFNVQNQDVEYAYVDVTFRYDYFTISGVDDKKFCV